MEKGWALITVLIVLFIMFALVGSFLFLATNSWILNERYHENVVALYLAEAGIDYALWEINYGGADFSGWAGDPVTEVTKSINDFQDSDGNIYGDIDISVYNFGQDIMIVRATGTLNSLTGPAVSRVVQVFIKRHHLFKYAILTEQNISMSGNAKTDSYDSTSGAYGGSNISDNGDIVTNGSGNPAISMTGNAKVSGDAHTAAGRIITKTGNADIEGEEGHTADEYMPPVTVPDNIASLPSGGSLSLSGNTTLPLSDGNYRYTSINLSGNSKLIISGNVVFYVTGSISNSGNSQIIMEPGSKTTVYFTGDLSISGNGVWNKTSDPSELSFLGTNTASNVSLTGNGNFHATVYTPSANVSISGNGENFGAVAGKTVNMSGNAKIHFDEQLANDSPMMGYDPYNWEEK